MQKVKSRQSNLRIVPPALMARDSVLKFKSSAHTMYPLDRACLCQDLLVQS